jgi:hypothetical protein
VTAAAEAMLPVLHKILPLDPARRFWPCGVHDAVLSRAWSSRTKYAETARTQTSRNTTEVKKQSKALHVVGTTTQMTDDAPHWELSEHRVA